MRTVGHRIKTGPQKGSRSSADRTRPSGSQPPVTLCGTISRDEAAAIIEALAPLGYAQVGLDRASAGSLDWAEGNGAIDFFILPLMPDAYPECLPVSLP